MKFQRRFIKGLCGVRN